MMTKLPLGQRSPRSLTDANMYWSDSHGSQWAENSHWRRGLGDDLFLQTGRDHLFIFELFSRAIGGESGLGVVVEWGCGGGANAVAFAPLATRFIAADVSKDSLVECVRQVEAVCDTPVEEVLIDIESPEDAAATLEGTCDTFLCLYVLELAAGPAEALRIIRIAERVLVSGGIAFVQIKYQTVHRSSRGHRRNYRRNLANMTTFAIDEFWLHAAECGLTPRLITLVPRNRLDARYAYYALTKA